MFEVQDKKFGQHVKQKSLIFSDQLSLLFCEPSRRKKWACYNNINNNNNLGQNTYLLFSKQKL